MSANTKVDLSSITLNIDDKLKTIAVLLIYDLDNKIIGQDRIVFNDDSEDDAQKKKLLLEKLKQEQEKSQDISVEKKMDLS